MPGTGAPSTRVEEALALVGLQGFERRSVSELSGGERQRVTLARSLAPEPRVLMLDEPLGSLDRTLRDQLVLDLRELFTSQGLTVVYVTHDQAEALALADHVAVIDAGGPRSRHRRRSVGPPHVAVRRPVPRLQQSDPGAGARRRGPRRLRGHGSRGCARTVLPPRSCAPLRSASAMDRAPLPWCAATPLPVSKPSWNWRLRTEPFSRSPSPECHQRWVRPSGSRIDPAGIQCSPGSGTTRSRRQNDPRGYVRHHACSLPASGAVRRGRGPGELSRLAHDRAPRRGDHGSRRR